MHTLSCSLLMVLIIMKLLELVQNLICTINVPVDRPSAPTDSSAVTTCVR